MNDTHLEKLQGIASALAPVTGCEWVAEIRHEYMHYITAKDTNFEFFLIFGGYGNDGRIKIVYSRPRNTDRSYPRVWANVGARAELHDPSITVGDTKDSATIAKDIVRRLLKDSENVHRHVLMRLMTDANHLTVKNDLGKRIEAAVGVKAREQCDPNTEIIIDPYDVLPIARSDYRAGYGEIKLSDGKSVNITLNSVPAELGVTLSKLITDALKAYVNTTTPTQ